MKYERATAALLEALYTTDEKAAQKYGVSLRSIQGWRVRLSEDEKFAAFFATKKAQLDAMWVDELGAALRKGVRLLAECAEGFGKDEQIYKRNPDLIAAIAGAVKICAEVYYTGKVIDARIAGQDRPPGQIPDAGDTDAESQYAN